MPRKRGRRSEKSIELRAQRGQKRRIEAEQERSTIADAGCPALHSSNDAEAQTGLIDIATKDANWEEDSVDWGEDENNGGRDNSPIANADRADGRSR